MDPVPGHGWSPLVYCEYNSLSDHSALGDETQDDPDVRRCFNCGSANHKLDDCPDPRNRDLIALSRQLFNFFLNSSGPFRRVHEVEQWKQQRVKWLEMFEPGRIQGPLLREALGLNNGDVGEDQDWLRNMAMWGYPKGWVGEEDPRLKVRRIIMEEGEEGSEDEPEEEASFVIHGEQDQNEELDLAVLLSTPLIDGRSSSSSPGEETASSDAPVEDSTQASDTQSLTDHPRRWVNYPETYFSSSLLRVYQSSPLPQVTPTPQVSSTFSADRESLWQHVLSQNLFRPKSAHTHSSNPPWRVPGTFFSAMDWTTGAAAAIALPPPSVSPPPPPPSSTPPPLPGEVPISSSTPADLPAQPLLHRSGDVISPQASDILRADTDDFSDNMDMEISDSE